MASKKDVCGELPYHIDFHEIRDRIVSSNIILVQAPDGIKRYMPRIVECLHQINGEAAIYVDAAPLYGACDLHLEIVETVSPDLIIHIGHNEYPRRLGFQKGAERLLEKTVFVPAYSKVTVSETIVRRLSGTLREKGFYKVSLAAVIQHMNILDDVKKKLEDSGLTVYTARPAYREMVYGQILGCEYSILNILDKRVDAHIVIAGGVFHALGASLSASKPVYKLDPYRQEYVDMSSLREKYMRKRLYKILQAMDAHTFGIVVGAKTGQYREWLIQRLTHLLRKNKREYRIYVSDQLTAQILGNIDNDSIDAYIVTSCPRLPIDDLDEYPKPVLTPGEAVMAVTGNIERYVFPW